MPSALKAPRLLSFSFRPYIHYRGQTVYSVALHLNGPPRGQPPSPLTRSAINRNVYPSSDCFTLEVQTNPLPYAAVVRRWAARRVRVAIKKQANVESRAAITHLKGHLVVFTLRPLIKASGADVVNEAINIIAACREKARPLPVKHVPPPKHEE